MNTRKLSRTPSLNNSLQQAKLPNREEDIKNCVNDKLNQKYSSKRGGISTQSYLEVFFKVLHIKSDRKYGPQTLYTRIGVALLAALDLQIRCMLGFSLKALMK